jgi:hypothetical protein
MSHRPLTNTLSLKIAAAYPPGCIGWLNRFLGINSWASEKLKNIASVFADNRGGKGAVYARTTFTVWVFIIYLFYGVLLVLCESVFWVSKC